MKNELGLFQSVVLCDEMNEKLSENVKKRGGWEIELS